MRAFFFVAVLLMTITLTATPAWAGAAKALYNPITGNITISATGDVGIGYEIRAEDIHLNRTAASDLGGVAHTVDRHTPGEITWANFRGLPTNGRFDAGNVIVPHTPVETFAFKYGFSNFIGVPGEIVVVPEPSAITIAGLTLFGAFAARRLGNN